MNENSYEFAFEIGPRELPPPLRAFADRDPSESTSLLLHAGPAAVHSGWAAGAAVSLAQALAAAGRRLVLGDLSLEEPVLHELLGGGNQEGMADIFLYGASLRRVSRPAGDGSYYFVPAGPYAPDPAEVMRHPRWEPVLQGLGAFGGFFNRLFSQFSNRDFATLMSVQFLTQAGQGVVQGAIGKSIAFGGQKGFDVQNVPSATSRLRRSSTNVSP
jgi:hypothetical protein